MREAGFAEKEEMVGAVVVAGGGVTGDTVTVV
jgi:hypothetical protein